MLGEFETRLPVLEAVIDKVQETDPETARRILSKYFDPNRMLKTLYQLHIPDPQDDPVTILNELALFNSKAIHVVN